MGTKAILLEETLASATLRYNFSFPYKVQLGFHFDIYIFLADKVFVNLCRKVNQVHQLVLAVLMEKIADSWPRFFPKVA